MAYVTDQIPPDFTGYLEINPALEDEVKAILDEKEFICTIKNIEDSNNFSVLIGKSIQSKDMRIDKFDILVLYQPCAIDQFKLVTRVKSYRVKPLKGKKRGKKRVKKTSQSIEEVPITTTDVFSKGLEIPKINLISEAAKPVLKVPKAAKQISKATRPQKNKSKRQRPVKLQEGQCFFCGKTRQVMEEIEFTGPVINPDNPKFDWVCKFPNMHCATAREQYKSATHSPIVHYTGRIGKVPQKRRERKQRSELQSYLRANEKKASKRVRTLELIALNKEREEREAAEAAERREAHAEKLKEEREAAEAAKVAKAQKAQEDQFQSFLESGKYTNF